MHRIGRTGRAGAKGVAHSLVSENDLNIVRELVTFLNKTNQEVSPELMELHSMASGAKSAKNKIKNHKKNSKGNSSQNDPYKRQNNGNSWNNNNNNSYNDTNNKYFNNQ